MPRSIPSEATFNMDMLKWSIGFQAGYRKGKIGNADVAADAGQRQRQSQPPDAEASKEGGGDGGYEANRNTKSGDEPASLSSAHWKPESPI